MGKLNLFKKLMKEKTSASCGNRPWTTRFHRAMTVALLALTTLGAKATDYVFVYNGNYLGINASGQITNYETFNPTYCVWTCYNGTDEAILGTSNTNLRSLKNGNYYLDGSTKDGNSPTLSSTAKNNWRRDDSNRLIYRNSGNYYLYFRGDNWRTSSSTSTSSDDNTRYARTYNGGGIRTDYRATATASTSADAKDNTTLPTVSCSELSSTTGILMSHTDLGGTYTPATTTLKVGGTTYYKGSDGKYTTEAPSATLTPSYAWSVTSGSASITSGGVLTLSNDNTQNVTVRLTATNSNPSLSKTVDYKFTATQTEELNETDYSDIAVTPASQTLDLGGTATYAIPQSISQVTRTRPLYVTITDAASHTFYKVETTYQNNEPAVTETPEADINLASVNWSAQSEGGAYFSLYPYYSATSNQVTLTRTEQKTASNQTFTITASAKYGSIDKEGTATVTIPLTYTDLTALHAGEAVNVGIGESESIEGHYTWEPDYDAAGAAYKKFTYTSSNTSIATVDAEGNVAGVAAGTTTITIQSEKLDGTDGVSCTVTVNVSVPAPTISIATDGKVTITSPVAGLQIRYTTDGSNPTATTGTVYSGIFTASNEAVVKAIAVSNSTASTVASKQYITSGISGNKVILNDYEDHNWTYYTGVDESVDGGNYNDDYAGKMYSPDPRNVKIEYDGNGGYVSHDANEQQNKFIYYETIEKTQPGETDDYVYTVIPNPFSKRPSGKGFGGWKIISGAGETNGSGNIAGHKNGDVLSLEEKLHFINLDNNYTANCTSATIELQATWVDATVTYLASVVTNNNNYTYNPSTTGDYEKNFLVINKNYSGTITTSKPVTITMVDPANGTRGDYSFTGNITVNNTGGTKIEYAAWAPSGNIDANGKNFTIGRGVVTTGQTGRTVQCVTSTSVPVDQTVRVESGTYGEVRHYYGNNSSSAGSAVPNKVVRQVVVWGCDYDRAKNDNDKLTITGDCQYTRGSFITSDPEQWGTFTYIKSGKFHPKGTQSDDDWFDDGSSNVYYMGRYASEPKTNLGRRYMEIQGGELCNIAGGSVSAEGKEDIVSFMLRVKGGLLHGLIYGCARTNNSSGSRCFVLTGGTFKGWVSPGTNGAEPRGDDNNTGVLNGYGYIYVGGNTRIDSEGNQYMFNKSLGGNVFGAGSGRDSNSIRVSGSNTKGTNVVVADNAYVERGIYGGGSFGYCTETTNIYITGGVVDGKSGGVRVTNLTDKSYDGTIQGGVYGGSCQNRGNNVNIYMTGGLVKTGIYGGSNAFGTLSGNANIVIVGGQVGTSTVPANVHGGGYGSDTDVKGAVTVTLGESGATEGATIYGGTYGGSALGTISSTSTININAGTFKGGIYGGGLGNESTSANVAGKSTVNMNGGLAEGGVYGGGNINSTVGGNVEMHIDGGQIGLDSDHTANIHGGGYGSQTVVTGNVDVTLGVATEDETATGATIYGNVYGGSALGKVNGSGNGTSINTGAHTNVTMNLGSVNGNIFGGGMGELSGTGRLATAVAGEGVVNGQINVTINGTDATIVTDDVKDYAVDGVFGGCDMVAYAGTPVVEINNCATSIDYVYGGGNAAAVSGTDVTINGGDINWAFGGGNGEDEAKPGADVNGNVSLTITGGTVNNIFGGSNTLGNITGTCDVIVDEGEAGPDHCSIAVGELYGGGNKAELYVAPNLDIRCLRGRLDAIYGGAKAADVHSDINLVIKSGEYGKVFGGNNQSGTIYGSIKVTVEETGCEPIVIGELYGCGNKAAYDKANDPDDPQDPQVNIISCTSIGTVYGGGLGETAVVTGNPVVSIQQEVGDHATAVDADGDGEADNKTDAIGVIGDVFGGGNAAKVVGSTKVKIGTDLEVTGADGAIYKDGADKAIPASANIRGNVYGGGNKAEVTGNTQVIVGPAKN